MIGQLEPVGRTVDDGDVRLGQGRALVRPELMRTRRRHEGDLVRIGAEEFRLLEAALGGPDHRHVLSDHLEAVADGTVAQPSGRHRRSVHVLRHGGAPVGDSRRQQHCARANVADGGFRQEAALPGREPGHRAMLDARPVLGRLGRHPGQQLVARDALGESRMVASAGNEGGPAGARVDHLDLQAEAGGVDRRGQAGGPGADDQAIHGALRRAGIKGFGRAHQFASARTGALLAGGFRLATFASCTARRAAAAAAASALRRFHGRQESLGLAGSPR